MRRESVQISWLAWLLLMLVAASGNAEEITWKPLAKDGLHDPEAPTITVLQEPAAALSALPKGKFEVGNQVDWVKALRDGYINPRTNIFPETKIQVLDLDILFEETSTLKMVLFPHKAHTEWLDCVNCHDQIFIPKKGANPVNMFSVLQGEYCGRCHGAVAFPLTQCDRCHSVSRHEDGTEVAGEKP